MEEKIVETSSIPESITIGGVTYSVKESPELQQFIQQVSKVEKTKLYSQMDTLKKKISELGNVEIIKNPESSVDEIVEKLKGTFVTQDSLKADLEGIVREVVKPVLDATKQQQVESIEQYRKTLIEKNAGSCIPELIKGNTKEELDKSLQESISLRAKYSPNAPSDKKVVDPLIQKQAQEQKVQDSPTPEQKQVTKSEPAIPQVPNRQSPDVSGQPSVKQMSQEEFAKQRDSLKASIEAMYGQH